MFEIQTNDNRMSRSQNLKFQGVSIFNDVTQKPCNGTYETNGTIVRFKNGLLHGGKNEEHFDLPAYQTEEGHIEFFENGLLHRENAPAVISDWGDWEEYWNHGELILIKSANKIELDIENERS